MERRWINKTEEIKCQFYFSISISWNFCKWNPVKILTLHELFKTQCKFLDSFRNRWVFNSKTTPLQNRVKRLWIFVLLHFFDRNNKILYNKSKLLSIQEEFITCFGRFFFSKRMLYNFHGVISIIPLFFKYVFWLNEDFFYLFNKFCHRQFWKRKSIIAQFFRNIPVRS